MKWNQRKILMAAAIPVIATVLPSVTYATCTGGVPDGPPSWDPSARISRYATIGWGTDIGPNVNISKYVRIGTCGQIGMDGSGGHLSSSVSLGNNVIITNGVSAGTHAKVGDDVNIDGTHVGSYNAIGAGSNFTNSYFGTHVTIGANAAITDSKIGGHATTGADVVLTGATFGYKTVLGNGVNVDTGSFIGRYSSVNTGVHLYDNVYVGAHVDICADVSSGMRISSYKKFGC